MLIGCGVVFKDEIKARGLCDIAKSDRSDFRRSMGWLRFAGMQNSYRQQSQRDKDEKLERTFQELWAFYQRV